MSDKPMKSVEERKAEVLIKVRGYNVLGREDHKDAICYIVELPKEDKKALVWCILERDIVGVQHLNQLKKLMKEKGVEKAFVVSSGRYTQSAVKEAGKSNIELLPETLPSFNIFEHFLVPRHEVLSLDERDEVLKRYRVKPYQLPRIKASDPAAVLIGAKPGDIVKIMRKDVEKGTEKGYIHYRYVVEG